MNKNQKRKTIGDKAAILTILSNECCVHAYSLGRKCLTGMV